ncbi:MAG: flagellar basal body-associated FliL family protein [Methylococcaceae bacterium]|nr:MAG: flagellar basal body-associated FliL family protein [Methylococcaceae bacterium]
MKKTRLMRIFSTGTLVLALMFNAIACVAEEHGSGKGEESKKEGEPTGPVIEYLLIEPPLVVNLQGKRRYVRADVQLLVEGQENLDRIKTHLPALRHTLIMLFGDHDPATLVNVEEREKLRKDAMTAIKGFLDQYSNSQGLKDVFFSSFLVQ